MTRRNSLVDLNTPFMSAALIAVHATAGSHGFRQRDVRFFLELFADWVRPGSLVVHNAQVLRHLKTLVEQGQARASFRDGKPVYRLTSGGILELTGSLARAAETDAFEVFLFIHYFVASYRSLVESQLSGLRPPLPHGVLLEARMNLDPAGLAKRRLEHLEREIQRLDIRATESVATATLVVNHLREGGTLQSATEEIQRRYPYQLNAQKPLRELMSQLPGELQRHELETGPGLRSELIWRPMLSCLAAQRDVLVALQASRPAVKTPVGIR